MALPAGFEPAYIRLEVGCLIQTRLRELLQLITVDRVNSN